MRQYVLLHTKIKCFWYGDFRNFQARKSAILAVPERIGFLYTVVMPPPRRTALPRFAPERRITLIEALDLFGRVIDPAWTGEEIDADTAPEPSDDDLASLAFARVTREASDDPRGELGPDNLTEREILAALHADRDLRHSARRRYQAAGVQLMRCFHDGLLSASAFGTDGNLFEVPAHLWGGQHAEILLDNGGALEVRDDRHSVPCRGPASEPAAIILIDADAMQELVRAAREGRLSTFLPRQPHRDRTGLPGRPGSTHWIEPEFSRRAKAGECEQTLAGEARYLCDWAARTYPDRPRLRPGSVGNQIRDEYNTRVRRTK